MKMIVYQNSIYNKYVYCLMFGILMILNMYSFMIFGINTNVIMRFLILLAIVPFSFHITNYIFYNMFRLKIENSIKRFDISTDKNVAIVYTMKNDLDEYALRQTVAAINGSKYKDLFDYYILSDSDSNNIDKEKSICEELNIKHICIKSSSKMNAINKFLNEHKEYEYLFLMDKDGFIKSTDEILESVSLMEKDQSISAVQFRTKFYDGFDKLLDTCLEFQNNYVNKVLFFVTNTFYRWNGVLFNVHRAGNIPEDNICEDFNHMLKMAENGYRIYYYSYGEYFERLPKSFASMFERNSRWVRANLLLIKEQVRHYKKIGFSANLFLTLIPMVNYIGTIAILLYPFIGMINNTTSHVNILMILPIVITEGTGIPFLLIIAFLFPTIFNVKRDAIRFISSILLSFVFVIIIFGYIVQGKYLIANSSLIFLIVISIFFIMKTIEKDKIELKTIKHFFTDMIINTAMSLSILDGFLQYFKKNVQWVPSGTENKINDKIPLSYMFLLLMAISFYVYTYRTIEFILIYIPLIIGVVFLVKEIKIRK